VKLGVLVSGSGTNLQAILEAQQKGELGAEVAIVIANRASAGALARAATFGVQTQVIPHSEFSTREAYDHALLATLKGAAIDLVVLAGFMRLLTRQFLEQFEDRVINIHPSLLPAFPGLHAQRQAIAYGAKVSGCTVHFVDEGCDTGAIIAQVPVVVLDGDDEASLSARILEAEHRLYPRVIRALSKGQISRQGRKVSVSHGTLLTVEKRPLRGSF
jgi:phosphoribosylglycinamide formyltransferase-1